MAKEFKMTLKSNIIADIYDLSEKSPWNDNEKFLKASNFFIIFVSESLLNKKDEFLMKLINLADNNNIPRFFISFFDIDYLKFEETFGLVHCLNIKDLSSKDKSKRDIAERKLMARIFAFVDFSIPEDKLLASFEKVIFLSYRKADYDIIKTLLSLIHSNERLRDIAIWFDDFLTPGENYNEAIENQLKNCADFMLLVTPNMLSKDNYVCKVEYPMAVDSKKNILPVCFDSIPISKIRKVFPDIPDMVNLNNPDELKLFLDYFISSLSDKELSSDSEHLFIIGISYLLGFFVERNIQLAEKLFLEAACKGYNEGYLRLGYMYSEGVGVSKEGSKAIEYFEKFFYNNLKSISEIKFDYTEILKNNNNPESLEVSDSEEEAYIRIIKIRDAISYFWDLLQAENAFDINKFLLLTHLICQCIFLKSFLSIFSISTYTVVKGFEIIEKEDGSSSVGPAIYGKKKVISAECTDNSFVILLHNFAEKVKSVTDRNFALAIILIAATYEKVLYAGKKYNIKVSKKTLYKELIYYYSLLLDYEKLPDEINTPKRFEQKIKEYEMLLREDNADSKE